ncbi:N-methylnicotinate transmembrane transporter [Aureococcus anophagefferens]|nr:N-methylnicotinate transmembrane transporter [Aureococcus anophagefferens]
MHREPYEEVQEAPEDAEETSPVDAALEEAGFNAVSVEVLLITGLGWFADGLETSALSVLLPALATEFSATAGELAGVRVRRVVLMHVFYELGELSAIGLAALLLPGRWRLFVSLLGAPTAVAAVLGALRLPESPRWLWARRPRQGRGRAGPRRAAAARPHARRQAPRRRVERRGRRGPAPLGPPGDDGDDGLCWFALQARFRRRSRTRRAAQVGSGWVTWAPEIAATRDLRSGPTYAVLAAARVLACTVFLLASALVERHGPWPTLLGFLACTTAASGGLAALLARRSTTTELRFGAAYCALTFFFNGVWPVLYGVTPAAFPTDARGAGFGAANVGKQLGAVALPLVAGALLHRSLLALGLVLTGGWLLGAAAAAVQARRPAYLARGGEEDRADGVDADSPLV